MLKTEVSYTAQQEDLYSREFSEFVKKIPSHEVGPTSKISSYPRYIEDEYAQRYPLLFEIVTGSRLYVTIPRVLIMITGDAS